MGPWLPVAAAAAARPRATPLPHLGLTHAQRRERVTPDTCWLLCESACWPQLVPSHPAHLAPEGPALPSRPHLAPSLSFSLSSFFTFDPDSRSLVPGAAPSAQQLRPWAASLRSLDRQLSSRAQHLGARLSSLSWSLSHGVACKAPHIRAGGASCGTTVLL